MGERINATTRAFNEWMDAHPEARAKPVPWEASPELEDALARCSAECAVLDEKREKAERALDAALSENPDVE